MKHTEFGHSVYFVSQNWGSYPNFSTQNVEGLYIGSTFSNGILKNTWEDWHLIPASRPTLPFPNQKTRTIDSIPNTNGNIDLSWSDVPYPVFENREDTFEFIYNPLYDDTHKDWTELYSEIASFIHGRHLRMVLEDDPGYYYEGRFRVEKWTSNTDGSGSTITIGYSVQHTNCLLQTLLTSGSGTHLAFIAVLPQIPCLIILPFQAMMDVTKTIYLELKIHIVHGIKYQCSDMLVICLRYRSFIGNQIQYQVIRN